jgi:hypothetical protein
MTSARFLVAALQSIRDLFFLLFFLGGINNNIHLSSMSRGLLKRLNISTAFRHLAFI